MSPSAGGFLRECWERDHSVLICRDYRSNCVPYPTSPSARTCEQVISLFPGDVRIPETYVDCLSHFASVVLTFCVHCIHYLNVVPVKGVTRPEVMSAQGRFLIALIH